MLGQVGPTAVNSSAAAAASQTADIRFKRNSIVPTGNSTNSRPSKAYNG